jgi:hypothetical protein
MRPYLEKNLSQKRASRVAQGIGPEFKPDYRKKMLKLAFLKLNLCELL